MKKTTQYIAEGFEKISNDLDFLMGCLEEVLRELGENAVADRLPWVGSKETGCEGFEQATSIAFQLLNMVEENTAARTRHLREIESGGEAEPGLWRSRFAELSESGMSPSEIAALLPTLCIEPVLTAHPTEAKRAAVLEQHRALYRLLISREGQFLSPNQQLALREEFKVILERLWRTGEILLEKPDVATERRGVLYYLREVFPPALTRLDSRLREAWRGAGFDPATIADPLDLPKILFGTWVGGDRDGHPLVTAAVTEVTLRELRLSALIVLHRELEDLAGNLPLSSNFQDFPEELQTTLDKFRRETPALAQTLSQSYSDEPWRQFVLHLQNRLPVSTGEIEDAKILESGVRFHHPTELEVHLKHLSEALHHGGAGRLARPPR